jgi:hypothetical protein
VLPCHFIYSVPVPFRSKVGKNTTETFSVGDVVRLGSYNDAELIAKKMEPQISTKILFCLLAKKSGKLSRDEAEIEL